MFKMTTIITLLHLGLHLRENTVKALMKKVITVFDNE